MIVYTNDYLNSSSDESHTSPASANSPDSNQSNELSPTIPYDFNNNINQILLSDKPSKFDNHTQHQT